MTFLTCFHFGDICDLANVLTHCTRPRWKGPSDDSAIVSTGLQPLQLWDFFYLSVLLDHCIDSPLMTFAVDASPGVGNLLLYLQLIPTNFLRDWKWLGESMGNISLNSFNHNMYFLAQRSGSSGVVSLTKALCKK